jgi:hypothetical protein
MPATDFQGSSTPFAQIGRSILSFRREQVHSMESTVESIAQHHDLDEFQKKVAERLHDLSAGDSNTLLSLSWIAKLLQVFLTCQEEFRVIMLNNRALLQKSPSDRLVSDLFERNVKALDVCNAIRDGIEQIRQWQKQLDIVLCALDNERSKGEGQFRRAKKALIDLAIGMLDEKESNAAISQRNRSFGRNNAQKDSRSLLHFRSLSWSVSRSWSAARQLQAIGNNLVAPRPGEIMATNGLSVTIYTMNYVLLFTMWALVAAIPCQDRGLQANFYVPKQFVWGSSIMTLHDRILEVSKKRERRSACGLLKEIHEIEKCSRHLNELTDWSHFPLEKDNERKLRDTIEELRVIHGSIRNGLDPFERLVREVFHRIVRSRTEGLDNIGKGNQE